MSVWVTPTILAGSEPSNTIATVQCHDAGTAVNSIMNGLAVWFDTDAWDDLVRDTLIGLGLSPAWAQRQIHAARTGTLLSEEDFA
jgi:hypothetical protein